MNDTKEIKAYYENKIEQELTEVLLLVKTQGMTDDTYANLRHLQSTLQSMTSAESFFNAWHDEGFINKTNIREA
jgi:hypothetical protein